MKSAQEYADDAIENWRISPTTRMSQLAVRVIATEAIERATADARREVARLTKIETAIRECTGHEMFLCVVEPPCGSCSACDLSAALAPSDDADKAPKCNICGKTATKTSGVEMHEVRKGGERVNVGVQYRCDDHDPHGKWFDIDAV